MQTRPWYRSRLFWLGLPGLLFLLWVWGDSFRHGSQVGMEYSVSQGGMRVAFPTWLVRLEYGAVVYQKTWVPNEPREAVIKAGRVTGYWRKAWMPEGSRSVWGSSVERIDMAEPLVFDVRKWWGSFGFVVAGYVAGWLLTLAWWQRRKSRLLAIHSTT